MKITAWINCKLLGYCPECNSTAPEIFMCPLCGYDTKYPFNMKKRNLYWDKYKKSHKKKYDCLAIYITSEIEKSMPVGLTQEEFAQNIGMSRVSMVNMLAGRRGISIRHLYEMAEALNIEARDLLPGIKWYKENKLKNLKK